MCAGDGGSRCGRGSPGLDVDDGLLNHLADPVDAPVGLLRHLVRFAVRGILMRSDHHLSYVYLEGYSLEDVQLVIGQLNCAHATIITRNPIPIRTEYASRGGSSAPVDDPNQRRLILKVIQ